MNRSILLVILYLFASVLAAEEWSKSGWENAFSRRNYSLGMSLAAFKAETFPDANVQTLQDPGNREVFPLCSNGRRTQDPASGMPYLFVPDELQKAGVVVCRYYYHYSVGDSPYGKRIEEARLLAAEWGTPTAFYFVKPEGADDYFLYQIESTSKQPIFNELLQAYTAAIGSPNVESRAVQNRFGAAFDNVIASWTNDVSTVRLEKYYADLDTLGIVLTLPPLVTIVEERVKGVALDRAKRL